MRIAVVSDIHGNLTAFEAVLADLRETSPDLILHGGDLADGGAASTEIIDQIRDLGWPGVVGNTDEMLFRPASLAEFAGKSTVMKQIFGIVEESAAWRRDALGQERLAWMRGLPSELIHPPLALVHASRESCWVSPANNADDSELESAYSPLGQPVVAYGHVHVPFIRAIGAATVVNSGSVGLPYDGDPRASYALLDGVRPVIRRVSYDVEREIALLRDRGVPHADWYEKMLQTAAPAMP